MWGGGGRCQPRAKRGFVIIFPLIKQAAALLPLSEKAANASYCKEEPVQNFSLRLIYTQTEKYPPVLLVIVIKWPLLRRLKEY